MTPLRIVFMGTPPLAATVLEALLARREFEVLAVVTQPDQPKGRALKLQPSAVKDIAHARGLDVLQPQRARDPLFIEEVRARAPDLTVVAAYGQILPQTLLDVPKFGSLNVHTSLLPKYRGAAPIQWAVLNGDAETGVTIMKMDAGLDTGDIVSDQRTLIRDDDTSATLHERLAEMGGELLVRTIPDFVAGRIVPRPQPQAGASSARKITKEDGKLDWSQPARALWNRVRGLTPWPGTYSLLQRAPSAVPLKIVRAQPEENIRGHRPGEVISVSRDGVLVGSGAGALRILELQREGGKRMTVQQFIAGFPLQPGERFG